MQATTPTRKVGAATVLDVALAHHLLPTAQKRREIRERAGVSQAAVGRALGVTPAAVSLWERSEGGREPTGDRLVAYVSLLADLVQLRGKSE